jgi:hypothetical protein
MLFGEMHGLSVARCGEESREWLRSHVSQISETVESA